MRVKNGLRWAALLLLVSVMLGCTPAVDPPTPPVETRVHVFADGSAEKPYEAVGLETDPYQTYDKDTASLGVWNKPKNNPMVISALPEDMAEYACFDMDVYFNKTLSKGLRLYIFCGVDENGEESYFYKDFATAETQWVTLSVPFSSMVKVGNPDLARAQRMELHINQTTDSLRELYVRSVSIRTAYEGQQSFDYGDGDVFDYIADRYAYLEFGDGRYAEEATQKYLIARINNNCKTWMDKVSSKSKTDPFGQGVSINSYQLQQLYGYMVDMARGYATPGSAYYKNEELRDKLIFCLDFMYENYYGGTEDKMPAGSNLHDSTINSSCKLVKILLALRDDLSVEQMKHYMDYMDILIPIPYDSSANMIDMSYAIILGSALQKDGVRLQLSVDTLSKEVFGYTDSRDGIYEDGSYLFHASIPYTTGYGGSLMDNLSTIMYTVAGSEYAFSEELVNRQIDWIFDSFVPVLFRGVGMSATSGRMIWADLNENVRGLPIVFGMARISQYAPEERAKEIKEVVKYYLTTNAKAYETSGLISTADFFHEIRQDKSITAPDTMVSAKVFPHMARVTTHRGDFASMLAMSSPTVSRYEGYKWGTYLENCNGWYAGAGMLYVYANSTTQFDQIYHQYANHYRLPGTTVETRERSELVTAVTGNESSFVGGVQLEEYALAAMQYDNKNTEFQSDLYAKKSYFFFDNEYVMLGADINSTKDEGVITTVENQKMISSMTKMYLNDDEKNVTNTTDKKVDGVKYAHITGYGSIVFPEKQTLTVHMEVNSGGRFLEIFFDHGVNPKNDTYSYIILPLASREEGKAYYENPDVEILSNTKQIQAVRENKLGLTGIVFWEAVEFDGIKPTFACTMLVKDTKNGKQIAVSDPNRNINGKQTIVVDGTYTLDGENDRVSVTVDGGKTSVTVDMTGSEGQSIQINLKKK